MIDDAMIKRLIVQCGLNAEHPEMRAFARACYAAGQRDAAEVCDMLAEQEDEDMELFHDERHGVYAKKYRRAAKAIRARTEEAKP